ncbi:MAG: VIT1/CCC1 family predicted Fe2+/Mn2+ transporter [Glaciecola sp.]
MRYNHQHRSHRISWIRAVVLGANDGIVSTASLIVGIAASNVASEHLFLVGLAALVAGAMSMAAGEYVSVSSQADIEETELKIEKNHIEKNWQLEVEELALIYKSRGLEEELALEVSNKLMAHDALGSHARDELGITDFSQSKPFQAALFSAISFSAGALLPLLATLFFSAKLLIPAVVIISLLSLVLLGSISAALGGTSKIKASLRILFWGALAMASSIGVGHWFNIAA